ncbi:hypothetical protein CLV84_3161 [Neolewinella xylanilytica]|uniref:Uncharacterized protein n=1 Tax=Neolewinella xylanilytica TaxID=1514080 RepID=A0A2S6I536_9BACT|nr:hypothetical protein [Neolewinella xylanilytica]PPK86239.1 hypothetical protein CLV84_3161 [Neolewinella xylanilytica]
MYRLLFIPVFFLTCSDGPPTTPETRPVDHPNAGNTAIYDVDADDPYEIDNGTFLDLAPGMLLPPAVKDNVSTLPVQSDDRNRTLPLIGKRKDTLGTIQIQANQDTIQSIHVTSPDVVTNSGIRVGVTYGDLIERLGSLTLTAGDRPDHTYAYQAPYYYLLNAPFSDTVAGAAPVLEIVIRR